MSSNLANEVAKFVEHIRILKRIKQNTNRAFHEIEKSGHFSDDILSTFLPEEEYQSLDRVCEKPPTIIVIGQSCHAKVCLINELLGEAVLPSVEELDNGACWRMIRIIYGNHSNLSLVLPNSFELATALDAYECSWKSVPRRDLELTGSEKTDPALVTAVAEISISHPLLQAGAQIICAPNNYERIEGDAEHVFRTCCEDVLPIVLYSIDQDNISDKDIEELKLIKSMHPELSIFFVRCDRKNPDFLTESMTESAQHAEADRCLLEAGSTLFEQLCNIGFLSKKLEQSGADSGCDMEDEEDAIAQLLESVKPKNQLIEDLSLFPCFFYFFKNTLLYHLVSAATTLNEAHNHVLGMFITAAFDMARDIIITPKRIDYALNKEEELYQALMDSASRKQEEIRDVIRKTILTLSPRLLDEAARAVFTDVELTENEELVHPHDLEKCVNHIQDLVLSRLNSAVAGKLISSVEYLRDSFTGTLSRCLECLELSDKEFQQEHESGNATFALKQVLDAAYQVEVTMEASSSLGRIMWEKMKQIVATLPGRPPPRVDNRWKKATAQDMLESLSEARLAKNICYQFKMRLIKSHEAFLASMRMLESFHSGRLERTEEQRMRVRKMYAPKLARLALESLSLRDMVMNGMPHLGREIGRGQYGVVYSCEKWAGHHPCAVKSVVPPDEKHWNDLAMEYYYTRSLPKHSRVVHLLGSVIDYNYAGGSSPAVLLIMERLQRDLYQGIKSGLSYRTRLQVALDVVEGLRFLHSQGLVHRDIKLKNVLLDGKNRGKITDLGFCKPGAMMSGSIVGTPIHMAPELFTCRYDSSVDVYAFGILFWYICAGHVRLPLAFEQCASKDQLWNSVRKGMRPEHLSYFEDDCWELMEQCWNGEQSMRPMLGHIQPKLAEVLRRAEARARLREAKRNETKLAQAAYNMTKENTAT